MFTCVAIRCIPIGTTRLRLVGVMSNLFFSRPQQSGRHATHGWLVKFLEHRIADRRVIRLIQKWLNAGVLEDGKWMVSEIGTVQGGSMTPRTQKITSESGSSSGACWQLWAAVSSRSRVGHGNGMTD